ncbi:MAG: hypothetical protein NZ899_11305 [Thermoguttaceae bacterium]|nr:hypothetical protein [Thermoguttaceae bacterium]MDW8077779.1 hypothetical protein [Thermoguttaceae bacterium]
MFRFLQGLANLVGSLLTLLVVALLGYGAWTLYQRYAEGPLLREQVNKLAQQLEEKTRELEDLRQENLKLTRELEKLRLANRLLKVDNRVAIIDVLGQKGSAEEDTLETTFAFQEVDSDGRPISPRYQWSIKGDILYVDAWVAKFQDEFVELGDAVRGGSIYLFRRLFGEHQEPAQGFKLDPEGDLPTVYRSGKEISDFEKEIWANFWKLANDPKLAAEKGLRAIHGEAPYVKLIPGKRYRVQLRASDGLSIVPEGEIIPARAG